MSWLISKALMKDYENSRSLPEQGAEFLEENSLDGKQFAQSNLTNTPEMYLLQGKTTEALNLSRYGMMCEHLMGSRGEDLLTWYQEVFLVRTLVPQEKEQELTENEADYGEKCGESLAKFDPDTHLWKTVQCSLLGGFSEFSEIWPKWGMIVNGELYQLPIPVLRTYENEYGSEPKEEVFPTPTATQRGAHTGAQAGEVSETGLSRTSANGTKWGATLQTYVKRFPTPTVQDYKRRGPNSKQQGLSNIGNKIIGQLNPEWVEWLMGWPIGHTELKPSATDKFQEWLNLHGNY